MWKLPNELKGRDYKKNIYKLVEVEEKKEGRKKRGTREKER